MTGIVSTSNGVMAGGRDAPPVRGSSPLELETRHRLSNEAWLKLGLLTAAFIGLFYRWIWAQGLHSAEAMEDWGHAFVIPFISGYMVWQQRERILRIRPTTFWPGLAPMMLGVVCYFFFIVGIGNHMLQGFAMILTLAGMSLLLMGPRLFRYVFLPISYLVFTVTVAEQVMIKLTFELQHIAAVGAWMVLRIAGMIGQFAVIISGNTLTVGSGQPLNVAEACSGMRMVIAFIAAGCGGGDLLVPLLVAAGGAHPAGGAGSDFQQHPAGGGAGALVAQVAEPGGGRRAHADRHAAVGAGAGHIHGDPVGLEPDGRGPREAGRREEAKD